MSVSEVYAVLTGDIIASSRILRDQDNPLPSWLREGETKLQQGLPGVLHAEMDIFRGDSWQMVLVKPVLALRAALLFRSVLRSSVGIDTRIAIGYGSVDHLPQDNISTGIGAAFTLSGNGLRDIRKPVRMNFAFPTLVQATETRALNTILSLIDLQVQRWTKKQSEAVSGALVEKTQQQIADSWTAEPVTQQAISQHLESAGWSQIKDSIKFVEKTLPGILKRLT